MESYIKTWAHPSRLQMLQTLGRRWKVIDVRQTLEAAKDKGHDHLCREG